MPTDHTPAPARAADAMRDRPRAWALTATLAAALGLAACAGNKGSATAPSDLAPAAMATLMTPQGQAAGQVRLTQVAGGVEVAVSAEGLTPGLHGFHIHANGSCTPGPDAATGQTVAFGGAGGHFDPGMAQKHGHPGQPVHQAHAGELPNLPAANDGRAQLRYVNPNVTVSAGPASVVGRSIVVHAQPDDFTTNPAGNSGPRVLCGVITAVQDRPLA